MSASLRRRSNPSLTAVGPLPPSEELPDQELKKGDKFCCCHFKICALIVAILTILCAFVLFILCCVVRSRRLDEDGNLPWDQTGFMLNFFWITTLLEHLLMTFSGVFILVSLCTNQPSWVVAYMITTGVLIFWDCINFIIAAVGMGKMTKTRKNFESFQLWLSLLFVFVFKLIFETTAVVCMTKFRGVLRRKSQKDLTGQVINLPYSQTARDSSDPSAELERGTNVEESKNQENSIEKTQDSIV